MHKFIVILIALFISACASTPPQLQVGQADEDYLWEVSLYANWANEDDCEAHVQMVKDTVAPQYEVTNVYSCPIPYKTAQGICHVSAMITTPSGVEYFMDNGTVLKEGFGSRKDFEYELGENNFWIGPFGIVDVALAIEKARK